MRSTPNTCRYCEKEFIAISVEEHERGCILRLKKQAEKKLPAGIPCGDPTHPDGGEMR